ncbi:MAG: hypothetical protein MOB07_19825 [Acidobacteria bacterium]|nr:hypothetical protein [Acidobacteriota bacterium]
MTQAEIIAKGYRKPTFTPIASKDAPALYRAEEKEIEAVEIVARNLCAHLGFTLDQTYTHALPEALANLLEAFDNNASILAATAYLETKGFRIVESEKFEALYRKFDQLAKEIIALGYYASQMTPVHADLVAATNRVEGLADAVEKLFAAMLTEAEREQIAAAIVETEASDA